MKRAYHPIISPRLATVRRWAGELSYRVATNRYVFYGSLILAASLIAGAVTQGHEVLWRSAAALGIAAVVIGLLHAWLDARSARRIRRVHTKGRVKEW
jgi:hypothetical protein